MAYYIAEIRISPAVEFKIRVKHNLTGDDVRRILIRNRNFKTSEKFDAIRGFRLRVQGKMENGQMLIAYLHPLDQENGIWFLGTAWKK